MKLTLTVHELPLGSVTPEHVSALIEKFAGADEVIVPIVTGPPD